MLRHIDQWRFGVFWQGDGSGDGSSGDGTSAAAAASAAADAAAAGFGGVGGDTGAPAGTSSTGTGGFGAGMGGDATAAPSATGTSVSFGGQAAPGGGVSSGVAGGVSTGVGGIGGPGSSAAGAGGGAATGGGGGTAAGGSAQGTNPLTANLIGLASQIGVPPGVLSGVSTATTPVSVAGLGPAGYSSNAINALNSALTALTGGTIGAGPSSAMGPGTPAPAPNTVSPLSQLALAQTFGNTTGMNMGFPAIEGVSPGVTAAPAGPSPGPGFGQVAAAPAAAPAAPAAPATVSPDAIGLASEMAAISSELGQGAPTANAPAPSQVASAVNNATNTSNVAPTPEAVQAQLAANQTGAGSPSQLLQLILGSLLSNPTTLAQLAQAFGGQVG